MHQSRAVELREAAYVWLSEGVSVVPAQPRSKAVWFHWRELEGTLPSDRQVNRWFHNGLMNLAVICGTGGLLVLDFDLPASFEAWRAAAGELSRTYTETSGKGMHLFYKVDKPETRRFDRGVEALGLGHLCNVAPSIHPNGKVYQVIGDPLAPILKLQAEKLFSLVSETFGLHRHEVSRRQLVRLAADPTNQPGAPIRNDVIGRIKGAFPLFPYASKFTELRCCGGGGRYLLGLCPFHQDESPSFILDQQEQKWLCHSPDCPGHQGGDVINFYALVNNLSVPAAIRQLAQELKP